MSQAPIQQPNSNAREAALEIRRQLEQLLADAQRHKLNVLAEMIDLAIEGATMDHERLCGKAPLRGAHPNIVRLKSSG